MKEDEDEATALWRKYHSNQPDFPFPVLQQFGVRQTIDFFNMIGLPLTSLEDGRMYPMSLQAGSGYTLAQRMGHTLIEPLPAIVQLMLQYPHLKALSGVKFEGMAHIIVDGQTIHSEYGEILFTDYGISGPPILQLSRAASYNLAQGKSVVVSVDLMPGRSEEEVVDFLEMHWGTFGHRTVAESLIGIINKKLIPVLMKEAGVDHQPNLLYQDLTWKAKKIFHRIMKRWEFTVTGTNTFTFAQTTAGGIDTTEIHTGTLESKLVPGLYFAGEVMDMDGDCGRYNLQWAWSSGYAAAKGLSDHIARLN